MKEINQENLSSKVLITMTKEELLENQTAEETTE